MMRQSQSIQAKDGHPIQVYVWPNETAKAWVHINHGMAEHAERYDDFAQVLVAAGYAVVAHNHRGHGRTAKQQLGRLAETESWQSLLDDIDEVRFAVCDSRPYCLFGHSMGSFIVQSYLSQTEQKVDGLIICASNFQSPTLSRAGKWVASFERWRLGRDQRSALLQFLSFGSFNQAFKPVRTEFDWLSRDNTQVDKYIADPLCGFPCSSGFWQAFLASLITLFGTHAIANIQANLAILMIGGTDDPVGMMGKGLPRLAKAYQQAGQKQLSFKLYEGARHEILNETNHAEVKQDIINWLAEQLAHA